MTWKSLIAAGAGLVFLMLLIYQISKAVHHTFSPPAGLAQVDKSTPKTQNGLTLLEIQNVRPDRFYNYTESGPQDAGGSSTASPPDTGLWIKLPETANPPQTCPDSENPGCGKLFSITGTASTGETFPMYWRVSRFTPVNSAETCVLLTTIPAGYPNTVQWVDVSLSDPRGDHASWRITHLPPMQHVLVPGRAAQTTFQQGMIHAAAHAYIGPNPNTNLHAPTQTILYDVKGTILGASHSWELGHLRQTREWEPPGFTASDSGLTIGAEKTGSTVHFEMDRQPMSFYRAMPYPANMRWVKLETQLQEFETYDETVTFHNISVVKTKIGNLYLAGNAPQTVTTPSGVTITLDDVQHRQNLSSEWGGGGYSLHLLYPQTMNYPALPRSPLWRKYRRPVKISADIPRPYEAGGFSCSDDTEGTYHLRTLRPILYPSLTLAPLPSVFKNFPIIIRQRVDLRAVPMTFLLPVATKPPSQP